MQHFSLAKKCFDSPDEMRQAEKISAEVIHLGDVTLMKVTYAPGWDWALHMQPKVLTDSCLVAHTAYVVSGHMCVSIGDQHWILGPDDLVYAPPGHHAHVVGDEPFVMIDFGSINTRPRSASEECFPGAAAPFP
jgi:quercetin dioxygenase-like cupin family protein